MALFALPVVPLVDGRYERTEVISDSMSGKASLRGYARAAKCFNWRTPSSSLYHSKEEVNARYLMENSQSH